MGWVPGGRVKIEDYSAMSVGQQIQIQTQIQSQI